MTPLHTLEPRLFDKIAPCPITGCAFWSGNTQRKRWGYGTTRVNGRQDYIHRVVYRQLIGPIQPGHVLHHTCKQRLCVEPSHLQPIKQADHVRLHLTREFCRRGHSMENAITHGKANHRQCRTCHNAASNARYHRRKQLKRSE